MTGEGWDNILSMIDANEQNETDVVALAFVAWVLKLSFIGTWLGWVLDLCLDIINFIKIPYRPEIFEYLLDRSNYPNDEAYLKKFGEYVRDLEWTRQSDMATGSSQNFSIFNMAVSGLCIIFPWFGWTVFYGFGGPVVWFIYAVIVALPSIQWINYPLTWLPKRADDAAADAPAAE